MGLFSKKKKVKVESKSKDQFSGWLKCSSCSELIHVTELEKNDNCCPKCDYHYRISVEDRIKNITDEGSFKELFTDILPMDPLKFKDLEEYQQRIIKAQNKSNHKEAVITGTAMIDNSPVALGVLNFNFMGGSMGSVVGEKITMLIEYATLNSLPLIIVSSSGGARMQESILSLMQMAKTSAALARLSEAGLPYISVLTNPTTGGVTASFASLGDIIIAEPNALIGFAGPRVIEQTIRHKLPEGFQRSEFLLEHGMIDCIVTRKGLKKRLSMLISFLMNNESANENKKDTPKFGKKLQDLLAVFNKEIEIKS